MGDKRHLRLYDLKQKIQYHPEVGTYVSEEDIDLMERIVVDETRLRHGEWKTSDTPLGKCCVCSVCGSCPTMEYRYCPYCGARMDGGKII